MRPTAILTTAFLLCTPCFAWPPRLEEAAAAAAITARQTLGERQAQQSTSTSYDLNYTGVQGNTATTAPTMTASGGNSNGTQVAGNNTSKATSMPQFDPQLPAGGISLITPNTALAIPTYYKIKDWVTFAWNYTSLSVTPSAVDVLATCAVNQATYTLALNATIPTDGSPQTLLWDTGSFQASATIPLLTASYTLIIKEAGQPVTARASSGYLGVFEGLTFAMYSPQGTTALADFVCVGCSGAMSAMEKQTFLAILGVAGVTVASFTWFAGVAGLW